MRQFDVFANPSSRSAVRAPYIVVLPFRYFLGRRTAVIGPLVEARLLTLVERLNPIFNIEDRSVAFSPMELVNIPSSELRSLVTNLEDDRERIIRALDFLFTGI